MRVDLLTQEYPPLIFGGAGVHIEALADHLRQQMHVRVHCYGAPRAEQDVTAYRYDAGETGSSAALQALAVNISMVQAVEGASLVHSHTWYANFAGHLAKVLYDIPHVATTHSLERLRPWKTEQLADGYRLSSYMEATALGAADRIIAVSNAMADDIARAYQEVDPSRISVVYNGIDTALYAPDRGTDHLEAHDVQPGLPIVACIARITPQKGLDYLIQAAKDFSPDCQLVIVAIPADTVGHRERFKSAMEGLRAAGVNVTWIGTPTSRAFMVQLLTHAEVLVCPSIYEPMGIVNLEAMACSTAVVGSAVGGIPEVVVEGETGLLVPVQIASDGSGMPVDGRIFAKEIASRVNYLLDNPGVANSMGAAGRSRAIANFSWAAAAEDAVSIYREVL